MPDPLTPDERAAIRARTDAATPGPYRVTEIDGEPHVCVGILAHEIDRALTSKGLAQAFRDAEFMAAARTDVPRLLDALEAAEDEVARTREAARTLGGIVDQQCRDIAKIARSEHLATEDGDADWGVIWEQAYEIADRAEKAEAERDEARAEVARLREQIDVDRAMHEAYRPEVVAEVAVHLGDDTDWDAIAAWCGGTIGSTQDPSGEYTPGLTIPGVGEACEGMWIVQRHDLTFAIRAELTGPSAESVARLTDTEGTGTERLPTLPDRETVARALYGRMRTTTPEGSGSQNGTPRLATPSRGSGTPTPCSRCCPAGRRPS